MAVLSLSFLGSFAALLDGASLLPFRSNKVQALLAYLVTEEAFSPGVVHRREALMELLWPGMPEASARQNLRHSLYLLRQAIPEVGAAGSTPTRQGEGLVPFVLADRQTMQVNPEAAYELDVAAFLAFTRVQTATQLEEAVALYRGEFLADFYLPDSSDFEGWAAARREGLRRQALRGLAAVTAVYLEQGEHEKAQSYARRQLAIDNLDESAHQQLMLALAQAGHRNQALAHYNALRQLLDSELGIEPSAEAEALVERIRLADWPVANRPQAASSNPLPRHNLPSQPTRFIGRQTELETVSELLRQDEAWLVTLTGSGGTGKTRLGLEVVARLLPDFSDGVFFVALASLRDPALVMPTIIQVLGLREEGSQTIMERLHGHLRDKKLLLVLDNFEHLLDAAPQIAELRAGAPTLKILVTSRTPMRLRGEKEFRVRPLALPEAGMLLSVEASLSVEAIRLFVERARDVQLDFSLSSGNVASVVDICRRLDGLPLAIELAAARCNLLTPQAILARLDEPLELLTTGAQDLPQRQRTLRAAIGWSYDLLEVTEQSLFRRLGVFAGGFALESAAAIWKLEDKAEREVLNALSSLVSKSLVQQAAIQEPGVEPRFMMLETVRDYALERLEEAGEAAATRLSHAHHFYALARAAEAQLEGPEQIVWLDQMEQAYENLRLTLTWTFSEGQAEMAPVLCVALGDYWVIRGSLSEGRYWTERVMAQSWPQPAIVRAKMNVILGRLAFWQGDYPRAGSYFEEGLERWRELGDKEEIARALERLGRVAQHRGDYTRAAGLYEESLKIRREVGNKRGIVVSLNWLGHISYHLRGDYQQATVFLEEVLALRREMNYKRGIASTLNGLAEIARVQGEYGRAEALYREALALCSQLEDKACLAGIRHNLAHLALLREELAEAYALFRDSLQLYAEIGHRLGIALCVAGFASLNVRRKQVLKAVRLLGAAEALLESAGAVMGPPDYLEYQRSVSAARAQLDEEAFSSNWAEGRALTLEEARAEALESKAGLRLAA